MAAYLQYVVLFREAFVTFNLIHIPREQNARVNLLAKLASSGRGPDRGQSSRKP